MRLPYWCPADHVLRMHYIAGVMPQVPQLPLPPHSCAYKLSKVKRLVDSFAYCPSSQMRLLPETVSARCSPSGSARVCAQTLQQWVTAAVAHENVYFHFLIFLECGTHENLNQGIKLARIHNKEVPWQQGKR